jgi:hypothetical protein
MMELEEPPGLARERRGDEAVVCAGPIVGVRGGLDGGVWSPKCCSEG